MASGWSWHQQALRFVTNDRELVDDQTAAAPLRTLSDAALAAAFQHAEERQDELAINDMKRATMEHFLADCRSRLSQPNTGEKIQLPSQRRNFVGNSPADVRRPAREAAYTAMEDLVAAMWPAQPVGSGVRVTLPTRDFEPAHDERDAVLATITYKNIRPEDYVAVLDVDHTTPPVNERFRTCRLLPSYDPSAMKFAIELMRTGCCTAAGRHLLRCQAPAWPREPSQHDMAVVNAWYRIVSGYPQATALQHGSQTDHDRWTALLTQHRSLSYDSILDALPCVICGSADSSNGNVIVYCDRGRYCRGTVAYHQMCVTPLLFQTQTAWNCPTCREYCDGRRTAGDALCTADAFVLKRQLFEPCWVARSADPIVPYVDDRYPSQERVYEPSQYMGYGRFSTARYPVGQTARLAFGFQRMCRRTLDGEADEARYEANLLDAERRRDDGYGSHRALALMRIQLMTSNPTRQLPFLPNEHLRDRLLWPDICEHARPTLELEKVHVTGLVLGSDAPVTHDGGGVRIKPYPFVSLASIGPAPPSPAQDPDVLSDDGFVQSDQEPLEVRSASSPSEASVDIDTDGYVLNDEGQVPDDITVCDVCGDGNSAEGNKILLCDGLWLGLDEQGLWRPKHQCCSAIHQQCCHPPLTEIPSGDWLCPNCDENDNSDYESSDGTASERDETDYFDSSAESHPESPTNVEPTYPQEDYRSGSDDEYAGGRWRHPPLQLSRREHIAVMEQLGLEPNPKRRCTLMNDED